MAIVNESTLPNIIAPVVATDEVIMCRDGVNLLGVPVSDMANGLPVLKNTAAPNATVPVLNLTATGTEANIDVAVQPKGTGAFSLQVPDGAVAGGNKRGSNAVDLQTVRTAATQVASGGSSFVTGFNNTASAIACVAMGDGNSATAGRAVALGIANTASGSGSVALGNTNTASGNDSLAVGLGCVASGNQSVALNRLAGTNGIQGQVALGHNSDSLSRYQTTLTGLRQVTTGTTPTRATADAAAAGTANQLVLRNNSVFKIMGRAVAYDLTTLDAKEFEFSTLIKRGANAAATSLVGTPSVTSAFADTAAAAWTIAITADTTNGALAVTVTGAGANQIRWYIEVFAYETGV